MCGVKLMGIRRYTVKSKGMVGLEESLEKRQKQVIRGGIDLYSEADHNIKH